jgi:hypothetical protein
MKKGRNEERKKGRKYKIEIVDSCDSCERWEKVEKIKIKIKEGYE